MYVLLTLTLQPTEDGSFRLPRPMPSSKVQVEYKHAPALKLNHMAVCPPPHVKSCLFCDSPILVKRMLDHVAQHIKSGDRIPLAAHHGEQEACGLCGSTTGQWQTRIVGKTITNTCKFSAPLQYKAALKKHRNVPRPCPIPGCKKSPFTLNVRHHVDRDHPSADIDTYDLRNKSGCDLLMQSRSIVAKKDWPDESPSKRGRGPILQHLLLTQVLLMVVVTCIVQCNALILILIGGHTRKMPPALTKKRRTTSNYP